MAIYSTCIIDKKKLCLLFVLWHSSIFLQYPKLETNSHSMLLHKSPDRQPSAYGQRITHCVTSVARYFCLFFQLCYAVLSPESQREYCYTSDLFIDRLVYIIFFLVLVFVLAFSKIAESLVIA